MPNNYFTFKEFTVSQDRSAMKVGTDGVLLCAWATVGNFPDILDVGTGTGLIALMMAQRNPYSFVDAVEPDNGSYGQAVENFMASNWSERLKVYNKSVQEYAESTDKNYDLIISNSPFFINSLKSPETSRTHARHTDSLPQKELILSVKKLLKDNGIFSVIYPYEEGIKFLDECTMQNFFCIRRTDVYPLIDGPVKRLLLEFSQNEMACNYDKLVVGYTGRNNFTEEYKNLTSEFYLKF
ncbi:MAG: methyltransferase [Rikenellaceae bacterium]|nr:methyltransferase [Rikenellaceae bacterium]